MTSASLEPFSGQDALMGTRIERSNYLLSNICQERGSFFKDAQQRKVLLIGGANKIMKRNQIFALFMPRFNAFFLTKVDGPNVRFLLSDSFSV